MNSDLGGTYRDWSRQTWDESSEAEKGVINAYAGANGYKLMNEMERGVDNPAFANSETREATRLACDTLAERIDRSECPQDTVAYRSMGNEEAQELMNTINSDGSKNIEHKGFMSAAISQENASGFLRDSSVNYEGNEYTPMLRLNVPKGTPAIGLGSNPVTGGSEGELLLQRNTQFEVDSVSPAKDTYEPGRINYLYINGTVSNKK